METMQLFAQLSKLSEFEGVAEGIIACQAPDRDGEILDYEASKPYFQQWSASQMAASMGKSKGNIRLQHDPKRPVGRLLDIQFDDAKKQVRVIAKVEETEAKNLLAAGVLTGFSIGGAYASKKALPNGLTSYVAVPAEVSVVDRPCAPQATFSLVRSDGSESLQKFQKVMGHEDLAKSYQAMIKAMPEQQAQMILGITPGVAYTLKKTNIYQVLNKSNMIQKRRETLEQAFGVKWFGGR